MQSYSQIIITNKPTPSFLQAIFPSCRQPTLVMPYLTEICEQFLKLQQKIGLFSYGHGIALNGRPVD